jgi:beta-mannosidase
MMVTPRETISLNEGWKYRSGDTQENSSSTAWQPARTLPTSIHLDLLANGVIPDPCLAKNEELVQWVGTTTWIYETSFNVPEIVLQTPTPGRAVVLVFEGLDTYATVLLNGQVILKSDNMFLSHRVDITEQICKNQEQTLQITFDNAEVKAQEEIKLHPEHNWFSFHFGSTRLAVRKAQYHFVSSAPSSMR